MDMNDPKLVEIRQRVAEKLGRWESRIQVSMQFTPKVKRLEGEMWTENGKTWVMKNGVPQNISVTQGARMPHWCPRCENAMNHRFDRKFYYLRGWCYNCNIDIEGQMRLDGTYEEFERRIVRENEIAMLKDKIQEHLAYIKEFKEPTVYFENGSYEILAKRKTFEPLFEELLKDVDVCLKRLEEIQKEDLENSNAEMANDS